MKLKPPPKLLSRLRGQPSGYDLPPDKAPKTDKLGNSVSTIVLVAMAFGLAALLTIFVFQSYKVDGISMEPTLQNNDRLVVDKVPRSIARLTHHAYIPQRGDIVVFNQANLPGYDGPKQLIKRVVGLPGERVVVKNGAVTVYNAAHPKGFNPDNTSRYHISSATNAQIAIDVKLATGQIFVCGDNRPNSEDSRDFGPINANQIVGKLSFRLFPISKAKHF